MSNHYITKEIKDRLYSRMRDKGVTSSDLCRVLNVAYPDLKATFEGKSPLYNKWQKKIADTLNIDKEDLFNELCKPKLTESEIRADARRKFEKMLETKINELNELASIENSEGREREEEKYLFAKECLEEILDIAHQQTSKAIAEIRKLSSQRNIELENAFRAGMNAGYGIDHENIHEEKDAAVKEFIHKISK